MALRFSHSAEGSTDEANVAAGVSTFGDPFTSVSKTGTMEIKYDNAHVAHGLRNIRFTRTASTDTGYVYAKLASAVTRLQARGYFYMDSVPTAHVDLVTFRNSSGFMGYVGLSSTGKCQAYNMSNVAVSGSGHATKLWAANTQYRLEAAIKAGATGTSDGTLEFAYYLGDSATAEHSFSSALVSTGAIDPEGVRFGPQGVVAGIPLNFWLDDAALGDGASGFLGSSTVVPPNAVVNNRVGALLDFTGSTGPTGATLSYSIAPQGGAPTPELLVTGVWFVVPDDVDTYTYIVTVSSSLGGTDDITVTVPPITGGDSVPVRMFHKSSAGAWE